MECQLLVDRNFIVVFDKKTGNEVESFPVSLVADPTCVKSDDKRETFNDIVLFTVLEDTRKAATHNGSVSAPPPSEMHIFQCKQPQFCIEIVDEIYKLKEGNRQKQQQQYQNQYQYQPTQQEQHQIPVQNGNYRMQQQQQQQQPHVADANNNSQYKPNSNMSDSATLHRSHKSGPTNQQLMQESERIEVEVNMLNHCFDDIERFVARLQSSLEYTRELERRRKERRSPAKKSLTTGGGSGEGMLGLRAQMPSPQQFVDIFQKFKLSFNLLARLKAHIHDPNAPELVHFLFTPLALIVNATQDPIYRGVKESVWQPLLSGDAKELLVNCLTSKEQDLWVSLGEAWAVTREDAQMKPQLYRHLESQAYMPMFFDGWSPSPAALASGKYADAVDAPRNTDLARMAMNTAAQVSQSAKYQQQQHQQVPAPQKSRNYPSSSATLNSSSTGADDSLNSSQNRPTTNVSGHVSGSSSGKAAPVSASQMQYAQQQQSYQR